MKLPALPDTNPTDQLMNKHEQANKLYPGITYDTAMPQEWVDRCIQEHDFDPRGCVVWSYPKDSIFGLPLPLNQEALLALINIGYSYE